MSSYAPYEAEKIIPYTLTDTTASATTAFTKSASKFAVCAVRSGGTVTYTLKLQGSLDGTNWTDLSSQDNTTDTVITFTVDKPVTYVRVKLSAIANPGSVAVKVLVRG